MSLTDLEGTKRAPIECDLAFLSQELIEGFWPAHDRELLQILRRMVSAQVATACWRNVTARPDDEHGRWHAEHHSRRLLDETR